VSSVPDHLLRPSVPDQAAPSRPPWRLGSQVYVAFFGGAAGAAIIALLNGARLGITTRQRWMIVALGAAGLLASAMVVSAVGVGADGSQAARVLGRVIGVVAWGGMYLVQRSADRVYGYRASGDDPYASLIVPGLLAAIAGSAVQIALIAALFGHVG